MLPRTSECGIYRTNGHKITTKFFQHVTIFSLLWSYASALHEPRELNYSMRPVTAPLIWWKDDELRVPFTIQKVLWAMVGMMQNYILFLKCNCG